MYTSAAPCACLSALSVFEIRTLKYVKLHEASIYLHIQHELKCTCNTVRTTVMLKNNDGWVQYDDCFSYADK